MMREQTPITPQERYMATRWRSFAQSNPQRAEHIAELVDDLQDAPRDYYDGWSDALQEMGPNLSWGPLSPFQAHPNLVRITASIMAYLQHRRVGQFNDLEGNMILVPLRDEISDILSGDWDDIVGNDNGIGQKAPDLVDQDTLKSAQYYVAWSNCLRQLIGLIKIQSDDYFEPGNPIREMFFYLEAYVQYRKSQT